MNIQEHVSLAPLTTFHIGGPARFFIEARTDEEIQEAIAYARELTLPLYVLGAGSNILASDAGVPGVVLKVTAQEIVLEENGDGMLIVADAGTPWEKIVDAVGERALCGIENLAGIPGTAGGAVVQNIGAYGAECADVFAYADALNSITGKPERIDPAQAAFGYRNSFFKQHPEYIVTRIALYLSKQAEPNISYPDLVHIRAGGTPLRTPAEITRAIRIIRAGKFPRLEEEGTAGSFFKNPLVPRELADSLVERFPGLPIFPQADGRVKIALAWLLDKALSLKGFSRGLVRLYEKQPLVVVARAGATATDVDAFASEIAERVREATGIVIEREVELFGA